MAAMDNGTLLLDDATVQSTFDWSLAIAALRDAYADDQIALYKSGDSRVQDLAVAAMCLRNAERLGLGLRLPLDIRPVQK